MPAPDEMLQIAPPSVMRSAQSSARWRMAAKFTSIVSTSENGGPGSPAQLNSAWIVPPICSIAAAVASGSRRSTTWCDATGTGGSLRSITWISAPRLASSVVAAAPIPAPPPPLTTTRLPSYRHTLMWTPCTP